MSVGLVDASCSSAKVGTYSLPMKIVGRASCLSEHMSFYHLSKRGYLYAAANSALSSNHVQANSFMMEYII